MTQMTTIHPMPAIAPGATLLAEALRSPQYVNVRRRVLRQLLESLIYEGVLTTRAEDDRHVVDGVDAHGDPVGYLFTMRRRYGFGRVRLETSPVLRRGGGELREAESLTRFLTETRQQLGADPARLTGFARELEETLLKDTIAQYVRGLRGDMLAGADYDELESMVMDGHKYHTSYKSRLGFDYADHLAWGPEFAADVHPLWIAAHRSISSVSVSDRHTEVEFLRAQLGLAYEEFNDIIRQANGDPAEYTLLPVHPWQWREIIAHTHVASLVSGQLIVLGVDSHAHRAQQSIRTLACREVPARAYLKLSLSIVNTSTSRVLASHTVANAPAISDWLRKVVDSDSYLRDELRVILLGEVMGSSVDPEPVHELVRGDTYGTLACIWRESLHGHLDANERAVPFTGLTARELHGTPLIEQWVRDHGVREWTRRVLEVSVLPLIHLLRVHGIAMESHAQNMVLVHVDGLPSRVALRDFHDGVLFSRDRLAEPALCPNLEEMPAHHVNWDSFVETEDLEQVTGFLLRAFIFINLGELTAFLEDAYGLAETEFWAITREIVAEHQRRFAVLGDRLAIFDVARPRLNVSRLTAQRLLPDNEIRMHSVPNPLCLPGRTEEA
jgi:2-[(L-alanin-3-ylcarbamoyl)methyl]-3-(2-aminoethylcarbamoyl)-2-hydroxypropanoate synthase